LQGFNFIRVNFIATSHSAIALVDNEEFIELLSSLNQEYALPSRKKLRDMILEEHEKIKEKVLFSSRKLIFQKIINQTDEIALSSNKTLSFYIDLWKSKAKVCPLCFIFSISITIKYVGVLCISHGSFHHRGLEIEKLSCCFSKN
jgi:hypothetical protein